MVSFVVTRIVWELAEEGMSSWWLQLGDRLQDIVLRPGGLPPVDGLMTGGAGEVLAPVEGEVPATGALLGGVVEAQLLLVTAPGTAAGEQPGALQVRLALVSRQENVGVAPGELLSSPDVGEGHQGDLLGRTGLDLGVGQTGVRHEGEVGVEVAGLPTSHSIGLEDPEHVLHLLTAHPAQAQAAPDEGRDVLEEVPDLRLLLPDAPVGLKLADCSLEQVRVVTF